MLKHMQSHSPGQTTGQITGAEFQIKQIQKDRNIDSHTVSTLIQRNKDPQKQIPPVTHYNDFQDTAHNQIPCTLQCETRYQVHHTWEAGNWNQKSFLAGIYGDKGYTCQLLYVCICFMCGFVYKHVLDQIPLSPAVALWDSNLLTLSRAGLVLLSQ